jgi:hypothetical protein
MKAIHLIQKELEEMPWPIERGSKIYESGYWDLTADQAKKLIGCKVYFHRKKAEPSFFGGIILDYRLHEDGAMKGRIIFKLESTKEAKGISTATKGFSTTMKIV